MDLSRLGIECQDNEVRYDMVVRKRPMERREKLVPRPEQLNAVREERRLREEGKRRLRR